MGGVKLDQTLLEKGLDINIDSELKFDKQAAPAASKANKLLALIQCSSMCINTIMLLLLFKTLVIPHLEYGNHVGAIQLW